MHVLSFYRFTRLVDLDDLRTRVQVAADANGLLGTVLLATEGINASVAGTREAIRSFLDAIGTTPGLAALDGRWTRADTAPFQKMKVKLRREIVTIGRPDLDPAERTAPHLGVEEWNALLDDPQTVLIDTRNRYEIEVGSFPGAIDPQTDNFRQFPEFVREQLGGMRDRPIAMFCTGGIRCEKATALLLEQGFERVYQLDGGILGYLDEVADEDNRWQGECFVFDNRVAVDAGLEPGNYTQCHACRRPVSEEDLQSDHYEFGVSCPACYSELEPERRARLEERRRQRRLAGESAAGR